MTPDARRLLVAVGARHRAWVLPVQVVPGLAAAEASGDRDGRLSGNALDIIESDLFRRLHDGSLFRGYTASCGCGWESADVRTGDERGEEEAWADWIGHLAAQLRSADPSAAFSSPRRRRRRPAAALAHVAIVKGSPY